MVLCGGTLAKTYLENDDLKPYIGSIDVTQDYYGFAYNDKHKIHWARV